MGADNPTPGVDATPAARAAITALRAARGAPLMFVQSGGCCAGSVPMCFDTGTLLVGLADVFLGEIEGCPFYIDTRLYDALRRPRFTLDVDAGEPGGFSLAAGPGLRFVTRSGTAGHADDTRSDPTLGTRQDG
jgi:uncharacterized protein (DUF779 family)